MSPWLKKKQMNQLRNEIGHIGYLTSKLTEQQKIHSGINTAMLQNLLPLSRKEFDLWDFEFKVFSQWGEDGIINHILQILNIAKPNCLEIGIEDFTECNTRFLSVYRNANLYLVDSSEAAQSVISNLEFRWKSILEFEKNYINQDNINKVIERASNAVGVIDVFSLDIDGVDYWILKAIDNLTFKLVIVEYNSIFGPEIQVTVPYNDNFDRKEEHYTYQFYGASISAFIELMTEKGYIFIGTNRANTNAFFVPEKYSSNFQHLHIREKSDYTQANVRESRNQFGELDYFTQSQSLKSMSGLSIFDLNEGRARLLKEVLGSELE